MCVVDREGVCVVDRERVCGVDRERVCVVDRERNKSNTNGMPISSLEQIIQDHLSLLSTALSFGLSAHFPLCSQRFPQRPELYIYIYEKERKREHRGPRFSEGKGNHSFSSHTHMN